MLGKAIFAMFAASVAAEEWDEVFKGNAKDMSFDDLFEELERKEPAFRWLSGNGSNASNVSGNASNATNATNTTAAATTAAVTTAAATTAANTTAKATTKAATKAATTKAVDRNAYTATISASFNIPVPAGKTAAEFAATLKGNADFKTATETQFKAGLCAGAANCAVTLTDVTVKTLRALEEAIAARRLASAEFVFAFDVTGLTAEEAHTVSSAGAAELAAVTTAFKAALKAAPALLTALGLSAADVDNMTAGTLTVTVKDSNGATVSTADLAKNTTTKKATTAGATSAGATTKAAATTSGAFEQSVVLSMALALFSRALF